MNILVFGATGMVGQAALRECLLAPLVRRVVVIGRHATGIQHEKLLEYTRPDVTHLFDIEPELTTCDACLFCLGVSSLGMSEDQYTKVTYDLTLAIAGVLARLNPGMTFIYVSGMGTDSSERGRIMWARVKGKTENALLRMPFEAAYMFRPGMILPAHGVKSKTIWTQLLYTLTKPLHPVFKKLWPNQVVSSDQLGRAMIAAVRDGYKTAILESKDIGKLGQESMHVY
jgi:uncharacterized protein YbjT (DUF2867 family)